MGFCEAGFILKELVLVGRWSLLFILLTQVFLLGVFLVYHDPFPFLFVNFSGQNFFTYSHVTFFWGVGVPEILIGDVVRIWCLFLVGMWQVDHQGGGFTGVDHFF